MNTIKLYHYPASRSARAKWILHETVGDNFVEEIVPLYEGRQYQDDYLQKNPNHAVPLLEITMDNGDTLQMIESGAMITFLADAFPEKHLAPAPSPLSLERADYLQMLFFGSSSIDMMLWQIRIHEHVLPAKERDSKTVARYRHKFSTEVEPQLVDRLRRTHYICGDDFSAADCLIAHTVLWAKLYGLCEDNHFDDYLSRVSKRPAFLAAFADAHTFEAQPPKGSSMASRFTG